MDPLLPGRTPALVVADRANARLQYFTLDGKHAGFVTGLLFPAHFDIRGDVLLAPDLHARVSLFDRDNKPIVHLGDGVVQTWVKRRQHQPAAAARGRGMPHCQMGKWVAYWLWLSKRAEWLPDEVRGPPLCHFVQGPGASFPSTSVALPCHP